MSYPLFFKRDDLLTPSWDEKRRMVLEREKKEQKSLKACCDPDLF